MSEDVKSIPTPEVDGESVRRHVEQQKKLYLSPKHYVAYILSGFGDTNWNSFSKRLFFFATTFLGIKPSTWGVAESASIFIDTLDNALSGLIIDRTRTRWGRVRPYILLTLPFWFFSAFTPWVNTFSWV